MKKKLSPKAVKLIYIAFIVLLLALDIYGIIICRYSQIILAAASAFALKSFMEEFEIEITFPAFMLFLGIITVILGLGFSIWWILLLVIPIYFESLIMYFLGQNIDYWKYISLKNWIKYPAILCLLTFFNFIFILCVWSSEQSEKKEIEEQRRELAREEEYTKRVYIVVDVWEEIWNGQSIKHLVLNNGVDVCGYSSTRNLFRTQKGHKVKVKWNSGVNYRSGDRFIDKFQNLDL